MVDLCGGDSEAEIDYIFGNESTSKKYIMWSGFIIHKTILILNKLFYLISIRCHEINSHEINSHEINSHEINSHEVNLKFPI